MNAYVNPKVGIQFVQIGNDPRAAADLRNLDDALPREHGIRVRDQIILSGAIHSDNDAARIGYG